MSKQSKPRDPLSAWPVIGGPLEGERRAWPADFFYVVVLPPPLVTPQKEAPPCRNDGSSRIEYRLHATPQGGFVWICTSLA